LRIKNALVVGVILLFIGVAVQPSMATVQPEYYDVSTEFIGLDKEYTTQLTKEELEELDALFDSVNERLNLSTSMMESVEIFKDAVIKLDRLRLLGNVGIQETENLVTGYFLNSKLLRMLERDYINKKEPNDGSLNAFCLIAGKVDEPLFYHPIILATIFQLGYLLNLLGLLYYWDIILLVPLFLEISISVYSPFCLARAVSLIDNYGFITSFGLMGLKYWQGGLDGMMEERLIFKWGTGIIGFTGLKIQSFDLPNAYFLGGALLANIEDSS
jgi:hypothetical protein